jgi:geranylgeranyl pyrophosphate synthase
LAGIVRSAALDSLEGAPDSDLDRAFLDRAVKLCRRAGAGAVAPVVGRVVGEEACRHVDPFDLVHADIRRLNGSIKDLLGSDHPVLATVAQYFFDVEGGKKIRPAMVLLMSRACNADAYANASSVSSFSSSSSSSSSSSFPSPAPNAKQVRLAEITEMIHTASLLHDDVIDTADSRRGVESVNSMFGNKLAVLAGDFLLARSSVCMARLRNLDVIELLATVIEHLVKGEVIQMKGVRLKGGADSSAFDLYLRKNYYKTGSLMANSCRASSLLQEDVPVSREAQDAAFVYGRGVGAAFQLVDDVLDFEASQDQLGKPVLNDLRQGLATAPVLFAQQQFPRVQELIGRKFEAPGDVEEAHDFVLRSDGLERTKDLAVDYSNQAVEAILRLEQSEARDALVALARKITTRRT